ncbi:MAG: hypothetical protein ACOYUZ_03460 [Patescibacteria group bacterium]
MEISKVIVSAVHMGCDLVRVTPYSRGTRIEFRDTREGPGLTVFTDLEGERFGAILHAIDTETIRGMAAVGWDYAISVSSLTLRASTKAGGRRHEYHDRVAALRKANGVAA